MLNATALPFGTLLILDASAALVDHHGTQHQRHVFAQRILLSLSKEKDNALNAPSISQFGMEKHVWLALNTQTMMLNQRRAQFALKVLSIMLLKGHAQLLLDDYSKTYGILI